MARYAITGGRGRLANALLPLLRESGDEWIPISRNAGDGNSSYDTLDGFTAKPLDAILHLAWSSVPASAEANPSSAWLQDFPLIERLISSRIIRPNGRFLFFSSGGTVYGETTEQSVTEDHPLAPIGQYGAAKVYAEKLIRSLCRKYEIRPLIFRVTNPYGIRSVDKIPQGAIGFALKAAQDDLEFGIWGDGTLPKDYLHITDLAFATTIALQQDIEGVYNVSAGSSTSLLEIISMIERISGNRIRTAHSPTAPWDAGAGSIRHNLLTSACGWKPKVEIQDGLSIEWKRLVNETQDSSSCPSP